MAKVEGASVTITVTLAEYEAIKEAIKVADRYEYNELWSSLKTDLAVPRD